MERILGQEELCEKIDSTTIDSFPKSTLLIGKLGSGKHLLSSYIAQHLNLPLLDITEQLSNELITDIYLQIEPKIYLLDMSKLSVMQSNSILKLVEEPLKNSIVILLGESDSQIIPTILNRCSIWRLKPYSREQLKEFVLSQNE